jgi:hypothetical protein
MAWYSVKKSTGTTLTLPDCIVSTFLVDFARIKFPETNVTGIRLASHFFEYRISREVI